MKENLVKRAVDEIVIKRVINWDGMTHNRDEERCGNCRHFTFNPEPGLIKLTGSFSAGACSGTGLVQLDINPDAEPNYIHTQNYSKCDLFKAKEAN